MYVIHAWHILVIDPVPALIVQKISLQSFVLIEQLRVAKYMLNYLSRITR